MQADLLVGGLYSFEDGKGRFGVAKVLALEPGMVHARLYKNKYVARPTSIDPATLSLGSPLYDKDFGIGHAPLSLEGFLNWQPVLLMKSIVTDEELVGYQFWKNRE